MSISDFLSAKVYCGTYGKYNRGSLDGGWLTLADYKTNEEFLNACAKLHSDEREPEFMFQDTDCLPEEFYSESCIYPEVFMTMREIEGMSRDERGAFQKYCDEKEAIPDMYDVDEFKLSYKPGNNGKGEKNKDSGQSALEELLDLIKQNCGSDYKGYYIDAMKFRDGFLKFRKQELRKSFCWGYSDFQGRPEEEANDLRNNFGEREFKKENLADFDRKYRGTLEQLDRYKDVTLRRCDEFRGIVTYCICSEFCPPDPEHDVTLKDKEADEFREEYKTIVARARKAFEKRIDSYLKRYGLTKIRKWTYWADE